MQQSLKESREKIKKWVNMTKLEEREIFENYKKIGGKKKAKEFLALQAMFYDYTFLMFIHGDSSKPDGTEWKEFWEPYDAYAKVVGRKETALIYQAIEMFSPYT